MKKWILPVSVLLVLAGGLGVYLLVPAKPEYCWLIFGREADLRVLVRLQGNKVSVAPTGGEEFTGPEEWLGRIDECQDVLITAPNYPASYVISGMSRLDDPGPPRRRSLVVNVSVRGPVEYRQYCQVELAASLQIAKEAHFDGPLKVEPQRGPWEPPPNLALCRGEKPTRLAVLVGTMNAEAGCWVVVCTQTALSPEGKKKQSTFPKGVYPVVDVEFPAKDHGSPIKLRYPLDAPC